MCCDTPNDLMEKTWKASKHTSMYVFIFRKCFNMVSVKLNGDSVQTPYTDLYIFRGMSANSVSHHRCVFHLSLWELLVLSPWKTRSIQRRWRQVTQKAPEENKYYEIVSNESLIVTYIKSETGTQPGTVSIMAHTTNAHYTEIQWACLYYCCNNQSFIIDTILNN